MSVYLVIFVDKRCEELFGVSCDLPCNTQLDDDH